MRVLVITPPAPVVTWADADAHLKLDGNESEKPLIEAYIAAATAHIDGPQGWLGRALGVQTLEARCSSYMSSIRLPYPPFIELVSAAYRDADQAEQQIDPQGLEVIGQDLFSLADRWPWDSGVSLRPEAVRIRYKAGYSNGIPAPIKIAILMMVADMHRNRATTQAGTQSAVPMSTTVEALLAPFQVYC